MGNNMINRIGLSIGLLIIVLALGFFCYVLGFDPFEVDWSDYEGTEL